MRIYQMTATFGKLEHETMTLKPGLNIIHAPNEWGKSTWCAFLVAMLYGLDTRAKTTKTTIADKERYAPWSGAPMEGRIDLNWKGRDITIERRTKRRVPLGEFRAYETDSGLPVNELNAANCGMMLLGVEQTVFRRSGFIRQADLPVTQDEALRRRLNALVTTGDESGAGDRLAENLRDLKNRCRYNRSGLLPQAEARRTELEGKLGELEALEGQVKKQSQRLNEVKNWITQLGNHRQALAWSASEAAAAKAAQAQQELKDAEESLTALEEKCRDIPSREDAEQKVRELKQLKEQLAAIGMETEMLPQAPQAPQLPPPFTDMEVEAARAMAAEDAECYQAGAKTKLPLLLLIMGALGLAAVGVLVFLKTYIPAAAAGVVALASLVWGIEELISTRKRCKALAQKYGSRDYETWGQPMEGWEEALEAYEAQRKEYQDLSGDVEVRRMVIQRKRESLCADREPEELLGYWQEVQNRWDAYHTARREHQRLQSHFETFSAMVKPVAKPAHSDELTFSEEETVNLLSECAVEQQRLQNRLGQYQGRMEALGDRAALGGELAATENRIRELEDTYAALTIALETLNEARTELQRRFAPRISKRAQELMSAMTSGRYQRMALGADFGIQTGTAGEDTLRDGLWRSDGTLDQLYLALRLAVAEELTPEAPLVLDDALVRFDDQRMKAAVEILRGMSRDRQIICFTCQERETKV